jgi:hypothetical protein
LLVPTSTEGRIALLIAFLLTRFETLIDMYSIAFITVRAILYQTPKSHSPFRDSLLDRPDTLARVIREDMGMTDNTGKFAWVIKNLRIVYRSTLLFQIIPTTFLIGIGLFALETYLCAMGWFILSVILAYLATPYFKPLVGYLFLCIWGIVGCMGALILKESTPLYFEQVLTLFATSFCLIIIGRFLYLIIDRIHTRAVRLSRPKRAQATLEEIEKEQIRVLNSPDSTGTRSLLNNLRALLLPVTFNYHNRQITLALWFSRLLPGVLPALGVIVILGQLP